MLPGAGLATEQQQQPHLYCTSCSRYGGTLTSKQYRIFDTSNNMKPPWLEEMACVGLKHRFFRCVSCAIEREDEDETDLVCIPAPLLS